MNAIVLKLERAINAISIIWNLKNHGDGSGLKLKQPGRNPVHLAQIFKAGNGISIIGQQGVIGREAAFRNPDDSLPIFVNRFVPHRIPS